MEEFKFGDVIVRTKGGRNLPKIRAVFLCMRSLSTRETDGMYVILLGDDADRPFGSLYHGNKKFWELEDE